MKEKAEDGGLEIVICIILFQLSQKDNLVKVFTQKLQIIVM